MSVKPTPVVPPFAVNGKILTEEDILNIPQSPKGAGLKKPVPPFVEDETPLKADLTNDIQPKTPNFYEDAADKELLRIQKARTERDSGRRR